MQVAQEATSWQQAKQSAIFKSFKLKAEESVGKTICTFCLWLFAYLLWKYYNENENQEFLQYFSART